MCYFYLSKIHFVKIPSCTCSEFKISKINRNLFKAKNKNVSFQPQPMSHDDIGIKDDSMVHCQNSPPTPRSLRLERVAEALAAQSSDQLNAQTLMQHRSVAPVLLRYACNANKKTNVLKCSYYI